MDANTRHFGAEIQAQQVEEEREARKIHADAEVVSATAL
jgi:hypothetical protein